MGNSSPVCLKIDVDTHDGMRDGVPRLLDVLARFGSRATFFLSFGPDNAGKAIWNVFRERGFLRKMVRTRAPGLYGWRTVLSGTLLPARRIASDFPDLVRRVRDEGHEVGVHAWDHRLWQDHLPRLPRERVAEQLGRAVATYSEILGARPHAVAAPGWMATRTSLEIQDSLGLQYASDMRGGGPILPVLDGYASATLQIPTTAPCLEEFITERLLSPEEASRGCGRGALEAARRMLAPPLPAGGSVVPLHAEVEGGAYAGFLGLLLEAVRASGRPVLTLGEYARSVCADRRAPKRQEVRLLPIEGRAGVVLQPVPGDGPGGRPWGITGS